MKLAPIIFSFLFGISLSQKAYCQIDWDTLAPLPPAQGKVMQPGVAGAFAGISDGVMMVAGGANFPKGLPWQGGVKQYKDEIYLFDFTRGRNGVWLDTIFKLASPIAYGASVTLNKGIICIGGRNEEKIFDIVYLLKYNRATGEVEKTDLPPLPQPLTGLAACSVGNVVYIAGGENESGITQSFYRIDLDRPAAGWESLPPWPGKSITNSVLVSQSNGDHTCVYLFGGKFSEPGQAAGFTNEVFVYDPAANKWEKKRGIVNAKKESIPLSAGAGLAAGNSSVILFGGNSALVYKGIAETNFLITRAKTGEQKKYLIEKLNSIFTHHPGFDRTIYVYDTVNDTWAEAGVLPYPSPATINAFWRGNKVILPSGEIRPGVRSPRIIIGTLNDCQ